MTNLNFWGTIVGESWYLNNQELFDSSEMNNLMGFLSQQYKSATIVPNQQDVFKAFRLTSYHDIRIVIVGQDPYPTITNGKPDATGLAFANRKEVLSLSPSLKNIRNAVEQNIDCLHLDFDVTLEKWAKQGVLLLNTALTLNIHKKALHKPFWEFFTLAILKKLNEDKQGLHFVFWGNDAKRFNFMNGLFHYTYEYTHPAAASYNNVDWKCTHFQEINNNITLNNGKEEIIKW